MGSRTADKLKEIEELRGSLQSKLNEIERRLPLAGFGKKIAAGLAGSSVLAPVLGFGFRRLRGGRKKKKKSKRGERGEQPLVVTSPPVTINVIPKGAAYLAAAGLVSWAGFKVYDAFRRSNNGGDSESFKPAVVPMPEPGRQTGF